MNRFILVAGLLASALLPLSKAGAQSPIGVCCGSNCCFVDAMCRTRGTANPNNPCEQCDPSVSQSAWSPRPGCGDAGPPPAMDAGPPPSTDGGSTPATDAGPPPVVDAGGSPDSGSTPPMDGGSTPPASGGGCSTAPARSTSFGLGALALLAIATLRRRR